MIQILDVLLQTGVGLLKRVHVFLKINCRLPFLKNFKGAHIDLFHQPKLVLLVRDQLIVHVHQDPGISEKLSVENTLFVQEVPEEDQFLLSLELKLDDFFLVVFIFTGHLGACCRLDIHFELLDGSRDLIKLQIDLVALNLLFLHILEESG